MRRRSAALLLCASCTVFGAAIAAAQSLPSATAENPATLAVPRSETWWTARHDEILGRVKALPSANLVLVGDSITQNYEKAGPPPDEVFAPIWQQFFAPHGALNLGYSGDQTQHVLWRLQHSEVDGLSPANVVLLIGTNNTAQTAVPQSAAQVAAGVIAVVETLHARLPKARIFVIDILPSAISPEKSAKDAAVNAEVRARYTPSAYVTSLDLAPLFMKHGALDTELFYDSRLTPPRAPLHPNTQGQRRMAEAVARALYGPSLP